MPVTELPLVESVLIMFKMSLSLLAAVVIPVTAPAPAILLIRLLCAELVMEDRLTDMAATLPEPQVQLLKMLFWMVLVELPASVFSKPVSAVVPVTLTLEKLLSLMLITAPPIDVDVLDKKITVPPDTDLVNVPEMLLLFTFCVPVAGTIALLEIKVTLAALLRFRLVNVLLLIDWCSVFAAFDIYVLAPVAFAE